MARAKMTPEQRKEAAEARKGTLAVLVDGNEVLKASIWARVPAERAAGICEAMAAGERLSARRRLTNLERQRSDLDRQIAETRKLLPEKKSGKR
jgi:uncharacterized protein with von Willebrand factor type A (vWA) domain